MTWRSRSSVAGAVVTAFLALAGCGGGDPGPTAQATAGPTDALSETPTAQPAPESLPPVNYRYEQPKGPDLCTIVVDLPALVARFDEVTPVTVPADPLKCPLDLHSGNDANLLDIKVQLDQNDADVYVWRNLDASMGNLVPIDGLGQSAYYLDTSQGRTLVVRDANMVLRLLFVANVNSGGAAVTDDETLLLGAIAEHLMDKLRVAA